MQERVIVPYMELREVISSVSSCAPQHCAVKEFVFLCRKIALVLLRKKMAGGKMSPEFFHTSLDDLALDCIADVFQQDESGGFIQIKTYFEGLAFHTLSDEDLLTHVRRLVFSKVNQGLFRMYNEADPSLGKILRNIKLSLQSLQHFVLVERFGEQCIAPASCETLEHLPPLSDLNLKPTCERYVRER